MDTTRSDTTYPGMADSTSRAQPQQLFEWLYMRDEDLSVPMRQPIPIVDGTGTPRYLVTHTRSWPSDRYEIAAADGRPVASIRQRHYGSPWYRAVMASGQTVDIRKDFFDADRWLLLNGMGLALLPQERYRPRAELMTGNGSPVARFDYERTDEEGGRISTRYTIGILAPGWEDVAVSVFALVRYEYLDYFDVVRGYGTP